MTTPATSSPRNAFRTLLPPRLWIAAILLIVVALGARLTLQNRPRQGHSHAPIAVDRLSPSELIALLGEGEHAAAAARDALIARRGADALPDFVGLFTHPRPSTRATAVEGAVELLTRPAPAGDEPPGASPPVLAALRERQTDYSSLVRLRVTESIRRVDRKAALTMLLAALRDEDEWIREAAARELGALKARESVPALVAGLNDPYPGVVGLCAAALRRITGAGIRYRFAGTEAEKRAAVAAWKGWWADHSAAWPAAPPVSAPTITGSAPAPPLAVRSVRGERLNLAELRGQIVLVNFLGSWCSPCVEELPGIAALQHRYGERGFRVIGLGVSEKSERDLRRFAEQHGLPFPVAIAPEPVLEAYGDIHEVPVSFLIDREGRVRRVWEGDRTRETFEAGLTRLLDEDRPSRAS